jgi:hypothetical protein
VLIRLDEPAACPEEEGAVEERRGGADYCGGYGNSAPDECARREEVVGYGDEAEGGGCEGGSM